MATGWAVLNRVSVTNVSAAAESRVARDARINAEGRASAGTVDWLNSAGMLATRRRVSGSYAGTAGSRLSDAAKDVAGPMDQTGRPYPSLWGMSREGSCENGTGLMIGMHETSGNAVRAA